MVEPEVKKTQVNNLLGKIFGKKGDQNLLDVYHYLMINYGYIPYEEFKKMDAHVVNELVSRLNKMNQEANKKRGKK